MDDDDDRRRRRLLYLSQRRGTKEADLVIGGFARRYLEGMTEAEVAQFEALLQEPDPDLMDWIGGAADPPSRHDNRVFCLLLEFKDFLSKH
jgi:antitoxin CptB